MFVDNCMGYPWNLPAQVIETMSFQPGMLIPAITFGCLPKKELLENGKESIW